MAISVGGSHVTHTAVSPKFGQQVYAAPKSNTEHRKLVIVESPFANPDKAVMAENLVYAHKALLDSLLFHNEAPLMSHLLYTQVLDEDAKNEAGDHVQRDIGINAGLAWKAVSEGSVAYVDRGISRGMQYGIDQAREAGRVVEERRLDECGHKEQVEALYAALKDRKKGTKIDLIA